MMKFAITAAIFLAACSHLPYADAAKCPPAGEETRKFCAQCEARGQRDYSYKEYRDCERCCSTAQSKPAQGNAGPSK